MRVVAFLAILVLGIAGLRPAYADTPIDAELKALNACLANAGSGSGEAAILSGLNPALNNPDQVAWCLFLYVNTAATSAGNNNALFETWASDGDTFSQSPAWPDPNAISKEQLRQPVLPHFRLTLGAAPRGEMTPFVLPFGPTQCKDNPPGTPCVGEEVRRNRATFEYIVTNKLYTRDGLKAFDQTITLPTDSIEVKANWVPVSQLALFLNNDGAKPDPSLYHVNTVMEAGQPTQYALVAMHVISKMVPNWTWATFEHVNNPGRCDTLGCVNNFGAVPALTPAAAPNGKQNSLYADCTKTAALTKLFVGVKIDLAFMNYCLKGTQTDFTDSTGAPTRVGNSVTEGGFVETASCMGCHGRAAYTFVTGAWAETDVFPYGYTPIAPLGVPDPGLFWQRPQFGAAQAGYGKQPALFRPSDFVWSIPFCAITTGAKPVMPCAVK
jgi:hypothetical protein